jgi:hypothetical protein
LSHIRRQGLPDAESSEEEQTQTLSEKAEIAEKEAVEANDRAKKAEAKTAELVAALAKPTALAKTSIEKALAEARKDEELKKAEAANKNKKYKKAETAMKAEAKEKEELARKHAESLTNACKNCEAAVDVSNSVGLILVFLYFY